MTRNAKGSASMQVVGGAAASAGGESEESVIGARPSNRTDALVRHEQPASEQALRPDPAALERERFAGVEGRDQQATGSEQATARLDSMRAPAEKLAHGDGTCFELRCDALDETFFVATILVDDVSGEYRGSRLQRPHPRRSGDERVAADVEPAPAQRGRVAGAVGRDAEHKRGTAREGEHVAGRIAGPLPTVARRRAVDRMDPRGRLLLKPRQDVHHGGP